MKDVLSRLFFSVIGASITIIAVIINWIKASGNQNELPFSGILSYFVIALIILIWIASISFAYIKTNISQYDRFLYSAALPTTLFTTITTLQRVLV